MRLWYGSGFLDVNDLTVLGGNGNGGFYIPFDCTVTDSIVTVLAEDIFTTLDANVQSPQSVQVFARLYSNNTPKDWVFANWVIPSEAEYPGGVITLDQLTIYNTGANTLANPPSTYLTAAETLAYFNTLTTNNNASDIVKGITYLDVAPAVPIIPRAVGTNSPRLPTQDENDALQGTNGAPSNSNRYVTNSDPRVNQSLNVALLATGGSGTEGDPYTGWDTAIGTWASNTTYLLNAGKWFSYPTPAVILNTTRTVLSGAGGPAFLKFTGTGIALTFKSTDLGGHYHSGVQDIVLVGNVNATEGLYLEATQHARLINVSVRDVSQKAFHFKFAVAGYYETLQCSQNGDAFSVVPVNGIYTELRGGNEPVEENTFVNTIIEGVSGDGIVLNGAIKNHFLSGTCEGNGGRGVYVSADSNTNTFGLDNEANVLSDWDIYGSFNVLDHVISLGLITIRSGSTKNEIIGGKINSLTIESGAIYPHIKDTTYNLAGTGVLSLNEPTTQQDGIFTNLGTGGSGGANFFPANPIIFAARNGGASWDTTTFNVVEFGGAGAVFSHKLTSNPGFNFPLSSYFGSGAWRYRFTGLRATNYAQQAGVHVFQTADAGVADAAITWTDVLTLGTNGAVTFDSGTASATAGAATLNKQSGTITSEALVTAAGATYTLTLTDSVVNSTSKVMVSVCSGTNSQGQPTVLTVTPGSGQVVVVVKNVHASDAFNGTLKFNFVIF